MACWEWRESHPHGRIARSVNTLSADCHDVGRVASRAHEPELKVILLNSKKSCRSQAAPIRLPCSSPGTKDFARPQLL